MDARIGWALAGAAMAVGWFSYGWQGFVLALTVVVFWLLLPFSRALRVMRRAAQAPVGKVQSAVMLHAKLNKGMRMLDIVAISRSLGRKAGRTIHHRQPPLAPVLHERVRGWWFHARRRLRDPRQQLQHDRRARQLHLQRIQTN